ncbi:hypothetical protein [Bosea massiliensis]|uniref:Uncharacterized protein n=1 Tax=Bosea massiliensis TaxID=151419 RepID=A0ABW0PA41_9HYPH
MTTSRTAAAEPRPESAYDIANDLAARAGDLRRLAEVTYESVTEFTAPAGTPQHDVLCRSAALCRVVEDYAKQLEARTAALFARIDQVTS